eukprot:CAMPEP_0171956550 /NCGR_PEP_ID=MMETSP0993-20121228/123779_1 /TAXON_ID=483369 /ORGANISM="non described non described, Strain CCMP2098" /LENGTH=349 /DNA_ID=CAMNT_0012603189 /DNA_START=22 /DNA_END=1071 /DNA_ORIENTATION=-
MKFTCTFALSVAFVLERSNGGASAAAVGRKSAPSEFIISVTASSNIEEENRMIQFDPTNCSNIYASVPYAPFESSLFATFDAVNDRYFLLQEGCAIDVYDARNLTKQYSLNYCNEITIQFPAMVAYESETDLLWLMWTAVGEMNNAWCSLPAGGGSGGGTAECFQYSDETDLLYTPDAAAFDASNRVLWAQVQHLDFGASKQGPSLIGFDTVNRTTLGPVPMRQLCQHMQVAYVGNSDAKNAAGAAAAAAAAVDPVLVCVLFGRNELVSVDAGSGSTTSIFKLPPLHYPVIHSSAVRQRPDGGVSYFLQLKATLSFVWLEVDVASGTVLSNSSYPAAQGQLALAMTVFA